MFSTILDIIKHIYVHNYAVADTNSISQWLQTHIVRVEILVRMAFCPLVLL